MRSFKKITLGFLFSLLSFSAFSASTMDQGLVEEENTAEIIEIVESDVSLYRLYISNIENNYIWEETDRKYSDQCEKDTMSGVYLDNLGNASYVRTIIECDAYL